MQETLDNCRKCSMCHWNTRRGRKREMNLFILQIKKYLKPYDWEFLQISCCQSLSHVWLYVSPLSAACQVPLFFTISRGLLKFMSTELVMPANHLILCLTLLLLLQSFLAPGSFSMSWLFAIGGQTIEASASASVSSSKVVKVKSLSCVLLFATLCTVAYQAPLSMGFSRQ